MTVYSFGDVVLVPFPFADQTKPEASETARGYRPLPRAKQHVVMEMLDGVLAQAGR